MKTAIGDILPFAVVVMISPINIIAAILLLFSKHPVRNASVYLAGFTLGVAGVVAGFVALAGTIDWADGSGPTRGAGAAKLALGVLLLAAGVRKLRTRQKDDGASSLPKWMDGIAGFSAPKSFGIGVAVGAGNPKNITMAAAAALSLATLELSGGAQVGAVAVYVVIAVLGVAAPVVVTLILGERSGPVLSGWKAWLERNNPVVMAVLFFVFAAVLIGQGIAAV